MQHRHRIATLAAAVAATFAVQAAPQGGQVSAGQGSIRQEGATTTIRQASDKLALQWQSFGIGAGETVHFIQPDARSIALNRVVGSAGSEILGRLNANGQVFLLNPNGVLFGRTAQVSVGGLLASTLDLSDADFLAGRTVLRGTAGVVRNDGSIRAATGGYIALVGAQVHNDGQLVADRGSVSLAAGSRVTLDFGGDGLLRLSVDRGTLDALVRNGGVVKADGGAALLTARAADALAGTVVNNTGLVRARTLDTRGGTVRLLGGFEGGTVEVGGTLDVSAPAGGDAGYVDTSGAHVRIAPGARVALGAARGRAGRWLVDPTDIVIDAPAAAAVGAALDQGALVTTSTAGAGADAGDITVASPVIWSGAGTWSLEADRDIALAAEVRGPSGGLSLMAGRNITASAAVNVGDFGLLSGDWRQVSAALPSFAAANFHVDGGSFLRATGGAGSTADPYRIADVYGLQGVGSNTATLAQNYALAGDVDASATAAWNYGSGFRPIGSAWGMFSGGFDGAGHAVVGTVVNAGGTDGVGLFGAIGATGAVRNLAVRGGSFSGMTSVGGVAGHSEGTLANVSSDAVVSGISFIGGVVGENFGTVTDSHADGAVTARDTAGGFAGHNAGTITRSWATGAVDGSSGLGGFVGVHDGGTISFSYATGAVDAAGQSSGGFVGWNQAAIANAYATGAVTALGGDLVTTQGAGGFFGNQVPGGSVTRVYSTGRVRNDTPVAGGLGGSNTAGPTAVSGAFWDTQTSGLTRGIGRNNGGTGRTTAQMMTQATFAAFDFAGNWTIYGGRTYPLLRAFLTPLTVTANDAAHVYDGTNWSGGNGLGYSVAPDARLLGTATFGGTAQGARNVGSYTITADGFHSTQQGYLVTYAPGALSITPRALAVTGLAALDKVYDTTVAATLLTGGAALSGVVAGDTVNLDATGLAGSFADKNVGNGKAVTVSGAALAGTDAGNYVVAAPAGVTASITPLPLSVTGLAASDKVYDATTSVLLVTGGATLSGVLAGDTVNLVSAGLSGSFADRNAGTGKAVAISGMGALAGADAGNYVLGSPSGVTAAITPAPLSVVADDQSKAAGTQDPALSYRALGFAGGETAAGVLAGALQRDAGEAAGNYAITQGSLAATGGNYTIAYTPGLLSIIAAPPPPPPSAPAPAPGEGEGDGVIVRAPYPRPEVPRALACAFGRGAAEAAAFCIRPLPLQVVDGGVHMPLPRQATSR